MYHYQKSFNEYRLIDDETGDALFSSEEIAVAFDKKCWTMLKHGPASNVESWMLETRKKYLEAGLNDIAADLTIISSKDWEIEELNKILDICDYIERFYQKHTNIK